MRVNEEELGLCDELRSGGIPLDQEVVEQMRAACRGLLIQQCGTALETAIFDLESGGAAYVLNVAIDNVSDRILRPQEPRLEIPWSDLHFRWLENPFGKAPREYTYSLPPYGPAGFDPEVVLNHSLRPGRKLYPGDYLEGLLLGVGQASIPVHYVDRQAVKLRLSIYDERGHRYTSDLILLVSRERKPRRQQAKESLRSGRELFGKHTQPGPARIRKVAA